MVVFPAMAETNFLANGFISMSTEQGAPNLGIAFSNEGVNLSVGGHVSHRSGWFVEGSTGNGHEKWLRISDVAVGRSLTMDGWRIRADVYQLRLDGIKQSATVDSVRLAAVRSTGAIRPYVFVQYFLGGLPGTGTALRVGMNTKFGFYAETGLHERLFGEAGLTHSFDRIGWKGGVDSRESGWVMSTSFVHAREVPVLENRIEFTLLRQF
jgi:hypothetical protein